MKHLIGLGDWIAHSLNAVFGHGGYGNVFSNLKVNQLLVLSSIGGHTLACSLDQDKKHAISLIGGQSHVSGEDEINKY